MAEESDAIGLLQCGGFVQSRARKIVTCVKQRPCVALSDIGRHLAQYRAEHLPFVETAVRLVVKVAERARGNGADAGGWVAVQLILKDERRGWPGVWRKRAFTAADSYQN